MIIYKTKSLCCKPEQKSVRENQSKPNIYSLACPYRNASIGVHLEHVVRPPSDRYQYRCLCSSQWAGRRCSSYAKLQVIPDTISNVGSWPLYQSKFLFYSSIYIFCNSTQSAKAGFLSSLNNFERYALFLITIFTLRIATRKTKRSEQTGVCVICF